MPPKAKISREMIVEAGLGVIRRNGHESLSVRSVAAELGCSTQPVMYHYKSVSELRADVYAAADELHTKYITAEDDTAGNPLLSLGLRYILFANEEKHLFRFLFQSDGFGGRSLGELLGSGEASDVIIQPLCQAAGLDEKQALEVFSGLFVCVHGAASLLANNSMEYDKAYFAGLLENTFKGAIAVIKMGEKK